MRGYTRIHGTNCNLLTRAFGIEQGGGDPISTLQQKLKKNLMEILPQYVYTASEARLRRKLVRLHVLNSGKLWVVSMRFELLPASRLQTNLSKRIILFVRQNLH